ncbi:MAG: hypothetical protein H0V44_16990, partial [Planctomycetes bacterium]|nr:hypothetical protein [Planctomycetota bacterium]
TDPRRVVRALLGIVVGISVIGVLATVAWAFASPPVAPVLAAQAAIAATPPPAMVTDTAAWNVALWRPASDATPVAVATTPFQARLFSILTRGDTVTAALDLQDGNGLVYARSGETVGGYRVERIDRDAVVLIYNGASQRVELAQ